MNRRIIVFLALSALPATSYAFTFSDGRTATCTNYNGRPVTETHVDGLAAMFMAAGYTGVTVSLPDGSSRITWDDARLTRLPPVPHDFIYFHECAHASVPTSDEQLANCVGLIDMRAAGRSSPAVENNLAAFHASLGNMGPRYGDGSTYWRKTVACADGGSPARQSSSLSTVALTTVCRFTNGPRAGTVVDFHGQRGVIPAQVGSQCTDGSLSYGVAVPPGSQGAQPQVPLGVSTRCHFDIGPRANTIQDYAPLPPLPIGASCVDGLGSFGHVVK